MTSLRNQTLVSGELLEQRLSEVRILEQSETERYAIVKDNPTGEHFLQYSYIHRNIAAGGAEELFHYLLPLESDDVLGILFNEQPFRYPDVWTVPYLRNGPDGGYVWFDPAPVLEGDEDEAYANRLKEKLLEFKRKGEFDRKSVEKLFEDVDPSK
ncbi:hypothetical protein [Paenibacillus thermotolerans]|uniref:hypothetical protein n=1 Tax=Paenibacillus thermotolerans TaxID=3027807 RepID=UPI003CC61C79